MDWINYLQSIREDPKLSPLREVYTITTVEGETPRQKVLNAAPLLFDFGLMVERVEEEEDSEWQQKKEKQIERLGVLEGLRKYAKDHVLLQGKPGSGKSTALRRLLLEEAETANQIPVLIELKFYEESIVGLIREFLGRHGASLSNAEITEALENGEFLLLVDGVNELPSEAARRDLETFRSRYQKSTAMIFTTRDLGLGGNLGIEKKLEMLPLSESQMREFVCAYLPDTGEVMLGKLKDRLREFGQTPLLLKMLCDLYAQAKDIPENLGLIFRAFTTQYENHPELKGKVPLGVSSKSFWGDLLQEIAFRMMQGADDPKEIAVAIPKSEAEKIIWEFCKVTNLPNSLGDARHWLEELLAYHLIELEGQNQITFCHQLIQEYYAAEKLLNLLPELDNWSLKWDYLNYPKWTESIQLMCVLIDSENQANDIIDSSLEVDYQLGAQLAGSVKKKFQKSTIKQILDLKLNEKTKIFLLGLSRSNVAVKFLIQNLSNSDSEIRRSAVDALGEVASDLAVENLVKALSDSSPLVYWKATQALGRIASEMALKALKKALSDPNPFVQWHAKNSLEKITYDVIIETPLQEKLKPYRDVPSKSYSMTNYLVLTAIADEFNAFKNCLDAWVERVDQNGFSYQQTSFSNVTLTLAHQVQMGETHTANLATRLISELKPKAIFMTGICAGNPDKVKLGDVIVASKIFKVDAGKQTPEGFFHDVTTYNLKPQWQHRLEDLRQDKNWSQKIQTPRPKTYDHQKNWLLHNLYDRPKNFNTETQEFKTNCPDLETILEQLWIQKLLKKNKLELTQKAINKIEKERLKYGQRKFQADHQSPEVHLGAMATTSSVQEDPELFNRIKKYAGQRNILGVEMEGAAIGAVAEITGIPMLVVKAVQDYGDTHKSDQFRAYAAEASARFLLKFLETLDQN